ncbi:sporulation protein YpjB [Paenibacillus sepulcri]|uniref:Sporulation protein YpjB n=1 Tax=Paenibacillus sepulcri TaxID=359917 RepID=A0ABS7C6H6_9BACL|nr:sporulation protein YpjB [Paenibacillus sepulcri]
MKLSLSGLIVGIAAMLMVVGCSDKGPNQVQHVQAMTGLAGSLPASLESLEMLSEAFYTAANNGNRQLSYTLLSRIRQAAKSSEIRQLGSQTGWKSWDQSVNKVMEDLTYNRTSPEWINEAARMKLAVDVLINPTAPLWLQYEDVLQDDLRRVHLAWKSQGNDHALAALQQLETYSRHIDRIEMAALMQRPELLNTHLQSSLDYIRHMLEASRQASGGTPAVSTALASLEEAASSLFGIDEAEAAINQHLPVMPDDVGRAPVSEQLAVLYISAIVMGILAFAGWRRYAFEQKHGTAIPAKKRR